MTTVLKSPNPIPICAKRLQVQEVGEGCLRLRVVELLRLALSGSRGPEVAWNSRFFMGARAIIAYVEEKRMHNNSTDR